MFSYLSAVPGGYRYIYRMVTTPTGGQSETDLLYPLSNKIGECYLRIEPVSECLFGSNKLHNILVVF